MDFEDGASAAMGKVIFIFVMKMGRRVLSTEKSHINILIVVWRSAEMRRRNVQIGTGITESSKVVRPSWRHYQRK